MPLFCIKNWPQIPVNVILYTSKALKGEGFKKGEMRKKKVIFVIYRLAADFLNKEVVAP